MRLIVRLAAVPALAAIALSGPAAQAADSPCKGLEQPVCETSGNCSWVKAYKTTKGRDVSAFCRRKPERKTTASSAGETPKAAADASAQ